MNQRGSQVFYRIAQEREESRDMELDRRQQRRRFSTPTMSVDFVTPVTIDLCRLRVTTATQEVTLGLEEWRLLSCLARRHYRSEHTTVAEVHRWFHGTYPYPTNDYTKRLSKDLTKMMQKFSRLGLVVVVRSQNQQDYWLAKHVTVIVDAADMDLPNRHQLEKLYEEWASEHVPPTRYHRLKIKEREE